QQDQESEARFDEVGPDREAGARRDCDDGNRGCRDGGFHAWVSLAERESIASETGSTAGFVTTNRDEIKTSIQPSMNVKAPMATWAVVTSTFRCERIVRIPSTTCT